MSATISAAIGAAPQVNLMPKAETERRARSTLAGKWGGAVVAALAVVLLASAFTFWLQVSASYRLVTENLRTTTLLSQISTLSHASEALALETDLRDFRTRAMATDTGWSDVFTMLQGALPEGVAITGFSLAPGGIPQGTDPALEQGLSGSLSLTSATVAEIVPLIRAVRPLPGVIDVDGWSSVAGEGRYDYELRIVLDQTVYTGAFAEESE